MPPSLQRVLGRMDRMRGQPQKRATNEAGAVPGPQEERSPFLSLFLSLCMSLPVSLSLSPVSLPSLCLCLSLCMYDGEQRMLHWRTSTRHQTAQAKSCAEQVPGEPVACVYFLGKGEAAVTYSAWRCGHVPGFASAGHTALPLLLTHLVPGVTDIHSIRR